MPDPAADSRADELCVDDSDSSEGAAREYPPNAPAPAPNGAAQAALAVWNAARKLVVLVVGSTVVLAGVVMLVTPGPAVVVIPAGLAILATEFVWARLLLRRIRRKVQVAMNLAQGAMNPAAAETGRTPATEPPPGPPTDADSSAGPTETPSSAPCACDSAATHAPPADDRTRSPE